MNEGGPTTKEGEPATTPREAEPAAPPPSLLAESLAEGESPREVVADAPSRREVASAFETWREEALPTPAGVVGPEPPAGGDGFDAGAAAVDEPSARGAGGLTGAGVMGEGLTQADAVTKGRAGVESKRRRAGAVVKENIMPRVGRMRDEALVVLEETPDDAGLRFVVIAAALFLLFLLFLFLSTTIK